METRILETVLGSQVVHELELAAGLARRQLYTEGGIRLGRAVEAGLYSTAQALNVPLRGREIKEVETVRNALYEKGLELMSKRRQNELISLASHASQKLAACLLELARDSTLWEGQETTDPRNNVQLLKDLIRRSGDHSLIRRLQAEMANLQDIQDRRNLAAHASIDGRPRELDRTAYRILNADVNDFLSRMTELVVGFQARSRS